MRRVFIAPSCGHMATQHFQEYVFNDIVMDDTCFVCDRAGSSVYWLGADPVRDRWLGKK